MNNSTSTPTAELRRALEELGAREFETAAMCENADRGLAAVAYAIEKGATRPVAYAMKVFDDPDWTPTKEQPRRATNIAVEVRCAVCDGDRFIVHRTRKPEQSGWMREHAITPSTEHLHEEMKPCPSCNASVDASFWKAHGMRFKVA